MNLIAFTGTQQGMTDDQMQRLRHYLTTLHRTASATGFIHGDCIGADEQFHHLVLEVFGDPARLLIHIYPANIPGKRAYCNSRHIADPRPPLVRNKQMVDLCDLLLVAPRVMQEQQRSGTWATYRYAKRRGRRIRIFNP